MSEGAADTTATVAVTGASGHLGANLVRGLLAAGHRVRALVYRDTRALDGLDLELIRGDVLDRESLRRAFEGVEVVYHLAAVIAFPGPDQRRMARINVEGTANVVETCPELGVRRLVHVGSAHILDKPPLGEAIDETRPQAAERGVGSEYDRTKAQAEALALAARSRGLEVVVGLPTLIYGPHDFKPSPIGSALLAVFRREIPAVVRGGYDWVDVRDVAAGLMAMAREGRSGERYILSGHQLSFAEVAALIGQVTSRPVPTWETPPWLALASAPFFEAWGRLTGHRPLFDRDAVRILQTNSLFSPAKAERELGYARRPPIETIHDTFTWFELAGMLG